MTEEFTQRPQPVIIKAFVTHGENGLSTAFAPEVGGEPGTGINARHALDNLRTTLEARVKRRVLFNVEVLPGADS